MKRIVAITAIIGITVIASVAIAQLRYDDHGKKRFPKKTQGVTAVEQYGNVAVTGGNGVYVVVARYKGHAFASQMIWGDAPKASFDWGTQYGVEFDIYEVTRRGTVGVRGFAPCMPDGVNNPDCGPLGDFPPPIGRLQSPHHIH